MSELEDLQRFIDMQPPAVRRNIEIVENKSNGVMLHIDAEATNPKIFYPMLSNRAADSENNNTARITVADTLLGCMIGYSSLYVDFVQYAQDIQGYAINGFDYNYCIKPNTKMVFDQDITNEHWLVAYNSTTSKYKPRRMGTFFVISANVVKNMRNEKLVTSIVNTDIFVHCVEEFLVAQGKSIKPGFYKISFKADIEQFMSFDSKAEVTIKTISAEIFENARREVAPKLSLEQRAIGHPLKNWL